jgi:hypothetical protein
LRDGSAECNEFAADADEGSAGDFVGAGEGVTGDCPHLGEAAGHGGGGVLADLVDGVLLVSDLLLDGGEVGGELSELVDDLLKLSSVSTAK